MKLSMDDIICMLNKPIVFPESEVLEYKSNIHDMNKKYNETICSFLNGKGGNLIFGISDDLIPIGLKQNTWKSYDKLLLQFDNIIHQQLLLGFDNEQKYYPITKENINVHTIKNIHQQLFIVVDIHNTPNVIYQLKDGSIYYRLHASNYLNKTEIIYTEETFNHKINLIKKDYQYIIDHNLKLYNFELDKKNKEILYYKNWIRSIFPCIFRRL